MSRRLVAGCRHGFTLVEILIVVLIIGILLAVAVPSFMKAREGSQAKACQHNLMQILGAKERWAMDNGRGNTDTPGMVDLTAPVAYIKNTPICPGGGTYTVGQMNELPDCSIGGTQGAYNAHVLP